MSLQHKQGQLKKLNRENKNALTPKNEGFTHETDGAGIRT
jgi:hypothetical protein